MIFGIGGGGGRRSLARASGKAASSAGSPTVVFPQFLAFFPADSLVKQRLLAVPSQRLHILEIKAFVYRGFQA